FSRKDAEKMSEYDDFLSHFRDLLQPLLDDAPPPGVLSYNIDGLGYDVDGTKKSEKKGRRLKEIYKMHASQYYQLWQQMRKNKDRLPDFYEFMTAPANVILNRWFESDILKTTLATDAVIGSILSPADPGSAYVLLHHVMGEVEGRQGVWAYCQGGMGSITKALAQCAKDHGAQILTNATVDRVLLHKHLSTPPKIKGVVMKDGTPIYAKVVLSNATPYHTFVELLSSKNTTDDVDDAAIRALIPQSYLQTIEHSDYACGAFKINCVVDQLPNFQCIPNESYKASDGQLRFKVGDQHKGTVHFESRLTELEDAAKEAKRGIPATRPVIEMTIPSSLDDTLVPKDKLGQHHIVQLFVQYAPYELNKEELGVSSWDDGDFKQRFADRVFRIIDEFAPNFSQSVLHRDLLSPRDLERVFGLHKGNIFHGALSLNQIGYCRPVSKYSSYRTPIEGLYLCGSGTHPGGGVMGAPGKNCAKHVLFDLKMY
ncbi:hypothetical protein RFI_18944, partial [Reticulomyxa filosa]